MSVVEPWSPPTTPDPPEETGDADGNVQTVPVRRCQMRGGSRLPGPRTPSKQESRERVRESQGNPTPPTRDGEARTPPTGRSYE